MSTRSIVKVKHTVPWGVGSIFATALETHNWTEFLEEDLHEFLKKTIKMAGRLAEKKKIGVWTPTCILAGFPGKILKLISSKSWNKP